MPKSYTALRVDERTHDSVMRYAEQLESERGQAVTVSEALTHLLEECHTRVRVSGATAKTRIIKRGRGAPRRYYAEVGEGATASTRTIRERQEQREAREDLAAMRKRSEARKE